jgi:enoyl-CoA hydratase/carnithine racemase
VERKDGGIAIVSLNRPAKKNALDMDMFVGIQQAALGLRNDTSMRAVIIQGKGSAFSSGLDVKSVTSNPMNVSKLLSRPDGKMTNLAQDVAWLWRTIPCPVIAVTHGICFGGGLQIALGADFRISTPDCKFSVMEAKWGLIPDMSGSVLLRELISIDLAKELSMTARVFTGEVAKQYGLISKVSAEPLEEALALVAEISTRSPDTVAAAAIGAQSHCAKSIKGRVNAATRKA